MSNFNVEHQRHSENLPISVCLLKASVKEEIKFFLIFVSLYNITYRDKFEPNISSI